MTVVDRPTAADLLVRTEPADAVDPIALYAAAVEAGVEAAIWLRPSEGFALVGVGRAWATEPEGPERFVFDTIVDGQAWRVGSPGAEMYYRFFTE